jgi:hypothetical protein
VERTWFKDRFSKFFPGDQQWQDSI